MPEKFPVGSRVTTEVDMAGIGRIEVPMRVKGYDGLKFVIVETLEEIGTWPKGLTSLMPIKVLTLREEVKYIPGEAEDDNGPAIGWMELGGLSVALTRDRNGKLLIAIEKSPEAPEGLFPVHVRISKQDGQAPDLWEGDVS